MTRHRNAPRFVVAAIALAAVGPAFGRQPPWPPPGGPQPIDPATVAELLFHVGKSAIVSFDPYAEILSKAGIKPTCEDITRYLREQGKLADAGKYSASVDELIARLAHDDWRVREAASKALLALPVVSTERLRKAAASRDTEVALRAKNILRQAPGGSGGAPTGDAIAEAICRTIQRRKIKGTAAALLEALRRYGQAHVLSAFDDALAVTATPGDSALLLKALASRHAPTRLAAARALPGALGKRAPARLARLAAGDDEALALAAAVTLANLGRREALRPLGRLLNAKSLDVRAKAVAALRYLSGRTFGYTAYAPDADRAKGAAKWSAWIKTAGATAKLHYPIPAGPGELGLTAIVGFRQNNVALLDRSLKTIWSARTRSRPWGCDILPNGHVLITCYGDNSVAEYDRTGKIVWEKTNLPVKPVSVERLADGHTLIACLSAKSIIEIDRQGRITWRIATPNLPHDARRLPNGNTLVAIVNADRVVEFDRKGKVVWEIAGLSTPYTAQRLPNGNTLVTDHGANRIVEYTLAGRAVWTYAIDTPLSAQRLGDGGTLMSSLGGILLIDRAGKTVCARQLPAVARAVRR